jgi:hypothetical protein
MPVGCLLLLKLLAQLQHLLLRLHTNRAHSRLVGAGVCCQRSLRLLDQLLLLRLQRAA